MLGDLIIIAVGLVVALAFSTLIKAFTDSIITPLINAIAGKGTAGKGLGWTLNGQRIDLGAFIGALIYFAIFIAVIYYLIVVPDRAYMRKRGQSVFGDRPRLRYARIADLPTCPSMRRLACTAPRISHQPADAPMPLLKSNSDRSPSWAQTGPIAREFGVYP